MAIFTPTVRVIVNGEPVDAATTNGPIADLTARTDWLLAQLSQLEAGTQLLLRTQNVESGVIEGTPVYLDKTDDIFKPALTEIDETNLNLASPRSFWQGIAVNVAGTSADIVLGGSQTLAPATWANVFEDGIFASGDIFLSTVVPGKYITEVTTAAVYIGHMRPSGELLARMSNAGAFTEHIHLQRLLEGDPADAAPSDPALGAPQVINSPDANLQGWLPANVTYFPGYVVGVQIPVGAVFGYNIQHPNETALQEILPVVPENNAQFEQGGTIIGSDLAVINNYGIWWMDNSYGNAPWPVDYVAGGNVALDCTLWTSRLVAESSMFENIYSQIINLLEAGGAADFSVTTLKSADPSSLGISASDGDAVNGYRGDVTISNLGTTAVRYGRGLLASAPSGNNVTGLKGLTDIKVFMDVPATHLWTEVSAGDQMALVTTNGVASGAVIQMRGHRLGGNVNDFIDFTVVGGRDLAAGTQYQPAIVIMAAVDTVAGAAVLGDVDVDLYRMIVGDPLGTTQLVKTVQATFTEGIPGELQTVALGPYADAVIEQGEMMLVRIRPATGGTPLTSDTLRVVDVRYRLAE